MAATLALTGCITDPAGIGNFATGRVKKLTSGVDLKGIEMRECVRDLPLDEVHRQTWVVVTYTKGSRHGFRTRTVRLPDGMTLAPGDEVRIDLSRCTTPLTRVED